MDKMTSSKVNVNSPTSIQILQFCVASSQSICENVVSVYKVTHLYYIIISEYFTSLIIC